VNLRELLSGLRASGVTLSVENERLKCDAPKGTLTRELRQELANHKFEIVAFLRDARMAAPTIPKVDRAQPLPLSLTQQRMWFLDRLSPGSPVYKITAFVRFRGEIELPLLEASVRELASRHECLRTSFAEREGSAVQVIHDSVDISLSVIDLTDMAPGHNEDQLQALLREQSRRPFDLTKAPLFRMSVIRMAPEYYVFALTIHHIVSDGWSVGIFFRELGAIYQAISSGKSLAIPAPPCQFADYSHWQQDQLSGGAFEADLAYWKRKLAGSAAVLDLPTDFPRPAVQGFAGAVDRFALPAGVSERLRKLAQQEGASDFMALLAVFKVLLTRYTHQSDISVGTPVVTRNRPELENLIGCFVNTMVLRTELPAAVTARDLLRSVRETVLEGHAHLHAPFEKVVEALRPDRSLSHSALFQVSFNFQNASPNAEFETLSVSSMFDLSLFMWEGAGAFHGAFEYRTDLFT